MRLSGDAVAHSWGNTPEQVARYFKGEASSQLASRIHLLALLLQEMQYDCLSVLHADSFIDSVIELICNCLPGLQLAGTSATPT